MISVSDGRKACDRRSLRPAFPPWHGVLVLIGVALGAVGVPVRAQSLLERTPNVAGGWTGVPGTLQFNFIHRFTRGAPPTRKVVSSPTFLVAAGLPWHSLVGYNYSTNSDLAPRYPNEWEFFGRVAPFAQEGPLHVDVGIQGGYNLAARSVDGELSAARWIGPVRVLGAARVFSDAFGLGETKAAYAAGAVLRLGRFAALAGDYASLIDRPAGYDATWSAALQLAIPYTPHTFSLQATNANTATLQGASASRGGQRRYGFEFTIPFTLSRYVPHRQARPRTDVTLAPVDSDAVRGDTTIAVAHPSTTQLAPQQDSARSERTASGPVIDSTTRVVPDTSRRVTDSAKTATSTRTPARPSRPAAALPGRNTVARASMREMAFRPLRIEIAAGATVVWTNSDAMVHTVSSDDGRWSSGAIEPGATWRRRFDRAGTYSFHCTPHPFMKGVVVVR
jgi:plastocyanin